MTCLDFFQDREYIPKKVQTEDLGTFLDLFFLAAPLVVIAWYSTTKPTADAAAIAPSRISEHTSIV